MEDEREGTRGVRNRYMREGGGAGVEEGREGS